MHEKGIDISKRHEEDKSGQECRECGCRRFRVIPTRPASGGRIMRRPECRHCGARLTTWKKVIGRAWS